MLDTNVFIAAFKSGWAKTTELLLELLTNQEFELVGNSVLLEEYRRWSQKLSQEFPALQELATALFSLLKNKISIVEPERYHLEACMPYFPESERADLYHAATCLKAGAILVSNNKHFNEIRRAGLIRVLSISEAVKEILG